MRRRDFITLLGGTAAPWSLAVRAQQSAKVLRIGYLGFGPASSWTSEIEALRSGLLDLGYVEGKNLNFEFRWAERADETYELATQLVRLNVDVIFAPASTQVEPARRATRIIPIVFLNTPILSVSEMWRAFRGLVGISLECRCYSPNSPLKSWRF